MSKNHARIGPKNGNWLGDAVGYAGAHIRMRKLFGRANHCESCGASGPGKRYEWANMTGRYYDPHDYKQMCHSCHMRHDIPSERRRKNASNAAKIGHQKRALLPRKTHCVHGHSYDQHGFINSKGDRECATCQWLRRRAGRRLRNANRA